MSTPKVEQGGIHTTTGLIITTATPKVEQGGKHTTAELIITAVTFTIDLLQTGGDTHYEPLVK